MIVLHALVLSMLLADLPSPITAAVARYESALQDVQTRKKGASMQRVYESAVAAAAAIGKEGELSENDVAALEQAIPVLRLRSGATPTIDAAHLLTLAEKHGSSADADFFRTYALWDASSCTRFGDGDLLAAYKAWFSYSRKYNPAYRPHVIEQIQRIEQEITSSTCMCENAETVKRALSDIARDFPLGKITPRIRQRIQEIDRGTSDMRFECEAQP